MQVDDIKKIAVIGGGTMGNGIAHVCAMTGYDVILVETSEELLGKALGVITKNLDRMIKKEKITEQEKTDTLKRIQKSTNLQDAKAAQVVIEAVFENLDVKLDIFRKLDEICPPDTILASNTSSLPITRIASATKRPDKVVGMHFMNPVPMMKLVEMIRGMATSDETFDTVLELGKKLSKIPVPSQDFPGFIGNRIFGVVRQEAQRIVEAGIATPQDIDTVMKEGYGWPLGIFEMRAQVRDPRQKSGQGV